MTTFWEGQDLSAKVDPTHAATVLGNVLNILGGTMGASPEAPAPTPEQAAVSTAIDDGTTSPVPEGTGISQGFGVQNDHESGHPGIDFAVPLGTAILAATSGTVTVASGGQGGYGNLVEITAPNGFITRYGHLSGINVQVGATVKAGQNIGLSGGVAGAEGSGNSTGPHLHFEVHDPSGALTDPTGFLAGSTQAIVGKAPATPPSTPASSDEVSVTRPATGDPTHLSGQASTPATAAAGANPVAAAASGGADNDPAAVDSFLAATRQHESGGDYTIYNQSGQSNASGAYQFIGTTWRGMGGSTQNAAEASPAEQDAVARKMALQLFEQFHSWRLVAIAWYGGPGIAQKVASGQDPGSPEGQGPYLAYGDTIQRMMSGG